MTLCKELVSKGFVNRVLRDHQVKGVEWMSECYDNQNGAILADDMGLGKTTQTISLIALKHSDTPSIVISPLSVLDNWLTELTTFLPNFKTVKYRGSTEVRSQLRSEKFDVLLTTYEMCLKDDMWLNKVKWNVLVVDEGHRLKNNKSLLSVILRNFLTQFRLILSGTPVQNNLDELYSLLNFIDMTSFPLDDMSEFCDRYINKDHTEELHDLLRPFLLRRTKSQVLPDLPSYQESVLYCGLTELQKKYYKASLMKDAEVINTTLNKTTMQNVVMQLRKCSNHPYMFAGAEPEPFVLGEHLIESSGKLQLLDKILNYCYANQHKVLIFSQFKLTLDILQDYLFYRNYTYERLDGSIRDEERFVSIKNFASNQIFVFLLSTRAGGVGLNLVAADTVIFYDSDWNPQNDVQAAARAHRIGQSKPVKMFRLVSRHTVEEIMLSRMAEKLKLTERVIAEGRFSKGVPEVKPEDLSEMLMFGLEKLFGNVENDEEKNVDMEQILGETSAEGNWVVIKSEETNLNKPTVEISDHYDFGGENYREATNKKDFDVFNTMVAEKLAEEEFISGSSSRHIINSDSTKLSLVLTPEEKAERAKMMLEWSKKQQATKQAEKLSRAVKREEKMKEKWQEVGYISTVIEYDDTEEEINDVDCDKDIEYIVGDATKPATSGLNLIIHCVDSSGEWGTGGMFSAISKVSNCVAESYEMSKDMSDLKLGQCHVTDFIGPNKVALLVCIKRGANGISFCKTSLTSALKTLSYYAVTKTASIHLPRIGASDWYSTERMLRKYLTARNIDTYVYYFRRHATRTSVSNGAGTSEEKKDNNPEKNTILAIFNSDDKEKLKRQAPGKRKLPVSSDNAMKTKSKKMLKPQLVISDSSDDSEIERVRSESEEEAESEDESEDESDWKSDDKDVSEEEIYEKEQGQDEPQPIKPILTITDSESETDDGPTTKLGDCFKNMIFFISPRHSKPVISVLRRYIVAFGGDLALYISEYTTHVVDNGKKESERYPEYKMLRYVTPEWVSATINNVPIILI